MKDKVYIKIRGLHLNEQGEPVNADVSYAQDETTAALGRDVDADEIETVCVGRYKVVNGSEYVHFEECYDGESVKSKNIIKITDDEVQVSKRGAVVAQLAFKRNAKTMTYYETPFGNLYFGIFTRDIVINRSEDEIKIDIDYSLEVNYEQLSECDMSICISSNFEELEH